MHRMVKWAVHMFSLLWNVGTAITRNEGQRLYDRPSYDSLYECHSSNTKNSRSHHPLPKAYEKSSKDLPEAEKKQEGALAAEQGYSATPSPCYVVARCLCGRSGSSRNSHTQRGSAVIHMLRWIPPLCVLLVRPLMVGDARLPMQVIIEEGVHPNPGPQ